MRVEDEEKGLSGMPDFLGIERNTLFKVRKNVAKHHIKMSFSTIRPDYGVESTIHVSVCFTARVTTFNHEGLRNPVHASTATYGTAF